jgi:hypothetical protein
VDATLEIKKSGTNWFHFRAVDSLRSALLVTEEIVLRSSNALLFIYLAIKFNIRSGFIAFSN